ncbi:MAG: putative metallopeptidase [Candidatus Thorarchaeota archaeon]|jgi:hypothetical protein
MKHWKDKSGELKKYMTYWLKREKRFRPLVKYNMGLLLVWREEHEIDKDGNAVFGKASKLSNKNRDIYGVDFMLTFAKDLWDLGSVGQRKRVMWHELCHPQIEFDDEGVPVRDNENRIKIWLAPHDLVMNTFRDEIDTFGLSAGQLEPAEILSKAYRAHMKANR